MANSNEQIAQKIDEIKRDHNKAIIDLLKATNQTHLQGKGKVTTQPTIDQSYLRWTLSWKQEKTSYDLNIVVSIEDDNKNARIGKVWVHRHASTDFDFEGHTPTTRMRRVASLSIKEIKEAIEAEFK